MATVDSDSSGRTVISFVPITSPRTQATTSLSFMAVLPIREKLSQRPYQCRFQYSRLKPKSRNGGKMLSCKLLKGDNSIANSDRPSIIAQGTCAVLVMRNDLQPAVSGARGAVYGLHPPELGGEKAVRGS